MICALVTQGKRVGIIATGHSVIHHLLNAVAEAAAKLGRTDVTLGHKVDEADANGSSVLKLGNDRAALEALQSGEIKVLGGTVWLWSRSEFARSVHVLFADEAGQMSLANVLAVTQAAHSIVLLGDPQQLEQPKKERTPKGSACRAAAHAWPARDDSLGRGIFLPETWRLSAILLPSLPKRSTRVAFAQNQGSNGSNLSEVHFAGRALWAVDVKHECNRNASDEEVEAVDQLVTALLKSGSRWVDELGREAQITSRDISVVAPFNAQVGRLAEKLGPRRVAVGTVDKFQGQEARVVIYSMTASSPEDAPRGLGSLQPQSAECCYLARALRRLRRRQTRACFRLIARRRGKSSWRTPSAGTESWQPSFLIPADGDHIYPQGIVARTMKAIGPCSLAALCGPARAPELRISMA